MDELREPIQDLPAYCPIARNTLPNRRRQSRISLGAVALLGVVVASGTTGCGYNARDAHYAKRSVAIAGQPGDGSLALVRQSGWPDEDGPVTALAVTPIESAQP